MLAVLLQSSSSGNAVSGLRSIWPCQLLGDSDSSDIANMPPPVAVSVHHIS